MLYNFNALKTSLLELYENLNAYIAIYNRIIENDKLKSLLGTLLQINNYLNVNTGKKRINNFDIRNLDNILNIKNNSQYFIDLLVKIFQINVEGDIILLNSQDSYLLKHVVDLNLNLINLDKEYEKASLKIDDFVSKVLLIVKSKCYLDNLENNILSMKELVNNVGSTLGKEKVVRKIFLNYFGFEVDDSKNDSDQLHSVLNAILSLYKKVSLKLKKDSDFVIRKEPTFVTNKLEVKAKLDVIKVSSKFIDTQDKVKEITQIPNKGNKENKKPLNLLNNKYKL
jgi:hypothetical protein